MGCLEQTILQAPLARERLHREPRAQGAAVEGPATREDRTSAIRQQGPPMWNLGRRQETPQMAAGSRASGVAAAGGAKAVGRKVAKAGAKAVGTVTLREAPATAVDKAEEMKATGAGK